MRNLYALGIAYLAIAVTLAFREVPALFRQAHTNPPPPTVTQTATGAPGWFARVRPGCNSVEAVVTIRQNPPPDSREGAAYTAACYALAGKIDLARRVLEQLPEGDDRSYAAGVVFEVGHPVADAGDDESAGPIMELVVEYQPGNYMALYHAGMSEYILGQTERAERNLVRFLEIYKQNDGWRRNAETGLARIQGAG